MKYVEGNLIELAKKGNFDIIVHGCNIFHTMGSGIAAQLRKEFPEVYKADVLNSPYGDPLKLGCFTQTLVEPYRFNQFAVVNLYTQGSFGSTGVHVDYDAIRRGFMGIRCTYGPYKKFGIPQIGAGLGGGDWKVIEEIIDSIGFENLTCVLYKG